VGIWKSMRHIVCFQWKHCFLWQRTLVSWSVEKYLLLITRKGDNISLFQTDSLPSLVPVFIYEEQTPPTKNFHLQSFVLCQKSCRAANGPNWRSESKFGRTPARWPLASSQAFRRVQDRVTTTAAISTHADISRPRTKVQLKGGRD